MDTIIKSRNNQQLIYDPAISSNSVIPANQSSVQQYQEIYLKVLNYLSEYKTYEQKKAVRDNINVYDKGTVDVISNKVDKLRQDLGNMEDSPNQEGNAFERINYLVEIIIQLTGENEGSIAWQIKEAVSDLKGGVSSEYDTLKKIEDIIKAHLQDYNNPHQVTKEQVGLANVDNTSDMDKPVSTATQATIDKVKEDLEQSIGEGSETLTSHIANKSNPHEVTKEQVGLGNVDNTADTDKPVSDATQALIDSTKNELNSSISSHVENKDNPHDVTKAQVGLDQVDNTSDLNKPVSTAQQEAINTAKEEINQVLTSHTSNTSNPHNVTKEQIGLSNVTNDSQVKRVEMGVASGVATLGEDGKVPASQLPSYVDDVIDCYATYDKSDTGILSNIKLYTDSEHQNAITGESGKIYVDVEQGYQFRWTGTQFASIGSPTIIGEVTGTAFDGGRGKALEDKTNQHIANTENPHNITSEQVGAISKGGLKTINGQTLEGSGDIKILTTDEVYISDSSPEDNSYKIFIDTSENISAEVYTKEECNNLFKSKVSTENVSENTKELQPNRYYIFSEMTELTITLAEGEEGKLNEYMFELVSGTTPTTLTLPETVKWMGDNTIEASKTYQVSIVNNIAVMGGAS